MEKKMITKKKRTIIISCVLAVLVIAGVLFSALKPDKKIDVETVVAKKETINETLDTTGTVSAGSEETFTIPEGVKVTALNVNVGDVVEAGTVIATFDIASLNESLNKTESAYEQAQAAYTNALKTAQSSSGKIAELKKQIAELEKNSDTTETTASAKTTNETESVKVSDALVKRFVKIAKLFGVNYSEDAARSVLVAMLSSGGSSSDVSSLMDSLSAISSASGSFDMSSFMSMAGSGTDMTLLQLKAQLALIEVQSGDTYVSVYKTVADKTREAYEKAQGQIDSMKNGWKAESKGIISEINIDANGTAITKKSNNVDISSILSAVTSGGDVTSMLSSFLDSGTAAVKILYYPLVADIELSKYDVLDVALNQNVTIKTASNKIIDGKVSYVSPVASFSGSINLNSIMGSSTGSSVTIPAQVTINGADSSLIVGVDVDVSIITDTKENTVVIPVEAVCIDGEEIYVYALENGKAVKKTVELGISNDLYYEVLSGVSVDDVLIKNTNGLEDGIKVNVK